MSHRWSDLDALLDRLYDAEPEARKGMLQEVEAAHPDLAREARRLLASADSDLIDPAGALATGILAGFVAGDSEPSASHPERIGSWRLVRELGRGGMGVVYLAERTEEDFEQRVALKLLPAGPQSEHLLRRFEQERRILAALEHPNIARLIDGGVSDDGAPWFAMEYVEGERIDAYCDRRRLPIDQRLQLFTEVAAAVQAAHRSLVVHRDLKPANILVTGDGPAKMGTVKLLDFGIAKPLDEVGVAADATQTLQRVLTPEYSSPEQIRGQLITTASDVYQLGLLLHELLTGRRAQQLEDTTPQGIERTVCEEPPTRPSLAVMRSPESAADGDSPEALATARDTTPPRLARRLRGDLDTILLTALRKEPARRYASAEQMADDVRRHLEALPVRARSDTMAYRASRFVRRHVVGIAATAAALILVSTLVAFYTIRLQHERDRAQAEAAKAEQVAGFLTTLLEEADPDRSQGGEVTVREVLDRAGRSIERELGGQPQLGAAMQSLIGRVYGKLGLQQDAKIQLAAAMDRQRDVLGSDHPDVAATADQLALVLAELGELDEAERLAQESLAIRERSFGSGHPELAGSLAALAEVDHRRGRPDEARARIEEALSLLEGGEPELGKRRADVLELAVRVEYEAGNPARAERIARRAVEVRRGLGSSRTLALAMALGHLGGVLMARGQPEQLAEAEELFQEMFEIQQELLGERHHATAYAQYNIAATRARRGDLAGGEQAFLEALEIHRATLGPDHPEIGTTLNNIAVFYHRQQRWSEAIDYYTRSLELRQRVLDGNHPAIGTTRAYLGLAQHSAGDPRAEATYRQALAELIESRGAEHEKVGNLRTDVGLLLAEQGRYTEAEPELRAGLAIVQPIFGDEDQRTDSARSGLAFTLCGLGRVEEAEPLLTASRSFRSKRYSEDHWRHLELDLYDAACLTSRGRQAEARRQIEATLARLSTTRPDDQVLPHLGRRLLSAIEP